MASPCVDCQELPPALPESGRLLIVPPLAFSIEAMRAALANVATVVESPVPETIAVELAPGSLESVAEVCRSVLSGPELEDARCLTVPDGAAIGLSQLLHMEPLTRLLERVQSSWLIEVLRDGRIETHFQPIVRIDGSPYGHECLLRGLDRDGSFISPLQVYGAASGQLLFHLDRTARVTAIRNAASRAAPGQVFINFTPSSVYNPAFCLRTTVEAVEESGLDPSRIVFEVVESDEVKDPGHLARILAYYREAGFRVALDDLGSGYASLNLLDQLRPDFVKLDMHLIRGVDTDPYKSEIAGKLLELANGLGIQSVAEGIETEGEWRWAQAHGATFAQGYLFGRPQALPGSPAVVERAA